MKKYDVVIVGAGPAGIFAAMEFMQSGRPLKILIIEKGKDIDERICPMKVRDVSCTECPECAVLCGWGGAGAFSDGKLNLSPEIGGILSTYISKEKLDSTISYVDSLYERFGAPPDLYGGSVKEIEKLKKLASKNDLLFVPSKIRHIGTDRCGELLKSIKDHLNAHVETVFKEEVREVVVKKGRATGVKLGSGKEIGAGYVVLAPGRSGAEWLEAESRRLKISTLQNPVDIGVRVELPASVMESLTKMTYEPKLIFYSKRFDDRVRTFCVNPYGEVVKEYLDGIWTVNGHSYANSRTDNTNFAILVSTTFTEPFNEPISYGRYVARLANFLGQGVIVQRLGDLKLGRRSTHERIAKGIVKPTLSDATPGDLSFVLPYRYVCDILEMLEALDKIAPGVNSRHTLLYGVEVKFYSMRLKLSETLETEVGNLFAVGDGAGVSRGLVQASVSGVVAAREIIKRLG